MFHWGNLSVKVETGSVKDANENCEFLATESANLVRQF